MAIRLKVSCRGTKRESILAGLAREISRVGREADEAMLRVLSGEGTDADKSTLERHAKTIEWIAGAS